MSPLDQEPGPAAGASPVGAACLPRPSLLSLEPDHQAGAVMAPVLVIGVGNRDRGDDAIGPLLLERLRARPEAGGATAVELLDAYQLQPEHALDLRGRRRVIVVDAAASGPAPFTHVPVSPTPDAVITTHSLSPAALAAVYLCLFGSAPALELLAVRGECFRLGAAPSTAAATNLGAALAWLRRELSSALPTG